MLWNDLAILFVTWKDFGTEIWAEDYFAYVSHEVEEERDKGEGKVSKKQRNPNAVTCKTLLKKK